MRDIFDQDPDGMAPLAAPAVAIIPASFGVLPDPAEAILEASPQVELFDETVWDVPKRFFRPSVFDDPTKTEGPAPDALAKAVSARVGEGAFPLVLAPAMGDVLGPMVRALGASAISVLHLSATPQWQEGVAALPSAGVSSVVSWGLRGLSREDAARLPDAPEGYLPCWRVGPMAKNTALSDIVAALGEKPTLLAIDLSVFDPSLMPAVERPEPAGPYWNEVMELLNAVARSGSFAGAIVTGLKPHPALHAADFLAAKLVYKILTCVFVTNR